MRDNAKTASARRTALEPGQEQVSFLVRIGKSKVRFDGIVPEYVATEVRVLLTNEKSTERPDAMVDIKLKTRGLKGRVALDGTAFRSVSAKVFRLLTGQEVSSCSVAAL